MTKLVLSIYAACNGSGYSAVNNGRVNTRFEYGRTNQEWRKNNMKLKFIKILNCTVKMCHVPHCLMLYVNIHTHGAFFFFFFSCVCYDSFWTSRAHKYVARFPKTKHKNKSKRDSQNEINKNNLNCIKNACSWGCNEGGREEGRGTMLSPRGRERLRGRE